MLLNTTCINIFDKKKDRTTTRRLCVSYFTFYNECDICVPNCREDQF